MNAIMVKELLEAPEGHRTYMGRLAQFQVSGDRRQEPSIRRKVGNEAGLDSDNRELIGCSIAAGGGIKKIIVLQVVAFDQTTDAKETDP